MAQLKQNQVDSIFDLLLTHGVSYESLQLDLLDHICCMVEQKMDNGLFMDNMFEEISWIPSKN